MNKSKTIAILLLSAVLLTSCLGKTTDNNHKPPQNEIFADENDIYTIPDFTGKAFNTELQEELSNSGYLLSVTTTYHDTVPKGNIISQAPAAGTELNKKGIKLEFTISAGKQKSDSENSNVVSDKESEQKNTVSDKDITTLKGTGHKTPKWLISPKHEYDLLSTFGKTAYSIVKKWDHYGIIDINCKAYGTGAYKKLYFCPEHGLSSPDVKQPVKIADDLTISPDCGYTSLESDKNIYVYDNSRSRVYLTGYQNGEFKIADITDTEFFKSNSEYIAVLYNCDADLMMYEDADMGSLAEIFKAENRNMHYGVINNDLTTVIEFAYEEIRDGNDCYIVQKDGKYGYRGLSGQYYYECIFEEANTAFKGAAWVKFGGKWGTVCF